MFYRLRLFHVTTNAVFISKKKHLIHLNIDSYSFVVNRSHEGILFVRLGLFPNLFPLGFKGTWEEILSLNSNGMLKNVSRIDEVPTFLNIIVMEIAIIPPKPLTWVKAKVFQNAHIQQLR